MNDNCFIDTNILVYCFGKDEPVKSKKAKVVSDTPNAFISTQVLTEFANTIRKKYDYQWNGIVLALNEINAGFNVHVNKLYESH
jgi:predicted nucleic acid-binding protein